MNVSRIGPFRQVIRHPVTPVLGLLLGAGAAKAGCGGCAASMIAASSSTYFGVAATAMLTRSLRDWISAAQPYRNNGFSFRALARASRRQPITVRGARLSEEHMALIDR